MNVASTETLQDGSVPSPKKKLSYQQLYALSILGGVPILSLALVYMTQIMPYSSGLIGDMRFYGVTVPTLAASALCIVLGILALTLRTRSATVACAVGAVLTAGVYYFSSATTGNALPRDPFSLAFLIVPVLAIVFLPRAQAKATGEPWAMDLSISKTGDASYTLFGLAMLFAWLLWFDFCFSIMESVLPLILQIKLNDLGISSMLYKALIGIIPGIVNFVLNPVFSIASDRHRGPRGRRIPFLMWGTPLVCAMLALIGFGNEISDWMRLSVLPMLHITADANTVAIYTFGVLSVAFFLVNMPLATTFYYLFNDVVPQKHFMKFMAYLRIVGIFVGMFYGIFIQGYSVTSGPIDISLGFWSYSNDHIWYPKLILVGAAVFYMLAGFVAYFKIREPHYPPPAALAKSSGFIARNLETVKTIVQECFCHRFYIMVFLIMTVEFTSYQMSDFMNPMRVNLGMDFFTLGKVGAATNVITLILLGVMGGLGDRYRALPLMTVAMALTFMLSPLGMLYLIPGLSPNWYLWIAIISGLIGLPIGIVAAIASGPLYMELLPRERYGQFSAAGSMIRVVVAQILAAFVAGWLMGVLRKLHHGSEYAWRYSFIWTFVFQGVLLLVYYRLYVMWRNMGGAKGFKPPPVGPVLAEEVKAEPVE